MSTARTIPTDQPALARAGVTHTARPGESVRILCRLEPEPDGTPAVGYYVEADRGGAWVCVTDGIAATADDGATNIVRLQRLAYQLDPWQTVWESEHGATV